MVDPNEKERPAVKPAEKTADEASEKISQADECRCKEVSKKSYRQLLQLAVKDLVFWKKTR